MLGSGWLVQAVAPFQRASPKCRKCGYVVGMRGSTGEGGMKGPRDD